MPESHIHSGASRQAGTSQGIEIAEVGLVLRPDARLVRRTTGGRLDLDADRERALAMLSVTFGRPMSADLIGHFEAASRHWQRGDKALANLRLIFAGLPRLGPNEARRLQLSEYLLDHGVPPRELMRELGLDVSCLAKYDPDQPRVPAGSGRESGQWTSGSEHWAYVGPAARSFLADATPEIVDSLARFASRFAVPTAILGALFIPTPNDGGVTEGVLPDAPDISFTKDDPAGILRLATKASDGSDIFVVAQNQRGLYVDLQTGQAIGRNLGGQLYLDLDAVRDTIEDTAPETAQGEPDERPKAATGDPKLCPAPTPDTPHGATESALNYEDDVHARVNPLLPIPPGYGVTIFNPATGRDVFFDDCFRYAGDLVDGDMNVGDLVEAKGPRIEYLYSHPEWAPTLADDVEQATKELQAADARGVGLKWYYAEQGAAAIARERFRDEGLGRIVIGYMPPRKRR